MPRTIIYAIAILSTASASATTYFEERPNAALTDTLVSGTVRSLAGERHGARILTRVTLETLDARMVDVLVPGGTVGGIRMHVAGAPELSLGERVELKTRATSTGLHLVGLGTGKRDLP